MKQNQDQLDKFFEEICKWDAYTDVMAYKDEQLKRVSFYSPEDYLHYQKQLLIGDLKALCQKNLQKTLQYLGKEGNSSKNSFQLKNCQLVKKFLVFELLQSKKTEYMNNQNDVVIVFREDVQKIEKNHFIAIVDSQVEGLLILKTILNPEIQDERMYNIAQSVTENSVWVVEKICNLVNFNKTYLALQSFQEIKLQEQLLEPKQIFRKVSYFPQSKQQLIDLNKLFSFDSDQSKILQKYMITQGIQLIDGNHSSGKSHLAVGILKSYIQISKQIKLEKEAQKQQKKVKTYTIKELLANESSEDEYYKDDSKSQTFFPWFQKGYKNIYDELDFSQQQSSGSTKEQYPTSFETDKKVILKPIHKDEVPLPERFLIVSLNPHTVDILLQLAEKFKINQKILRIGQSSSNEQLNKQYSIEFLSGLNLKKQRDENTDEIKEQLLKQAAIVFITFSQVTVHVLEKSLVKFDTIIIDDASLINEIDILQVMKHNASRLIMIGNRNIEQGMFLLNPKSDRTLYQRILLANQDEQNIMTLTGSYSKKVEPIQQEAPAKGKRTAKKGQAKAEEKKVVFTEQQIIFIDVSQSEEKEQKESFQNEPEAQSIIDYLKTQTDSIDFSNLAVMSPFRTQALLIKNTLQEREDVEDQTIKNFKEIGSFDEFVGRTFQTVLVSLCKTKNITKLGGPLLNSPLNIQYLKSRATQTIIIFGRAKSLNALWKNEFYEKSKAQNTLIEI